MAFKGESYIPLIIRAKPTEGDIWRVRDNGMLFGIPLKGGDFIEWTGSAWQLRQDLHYKLDDGTGAGVQDEAITTEFAPLEEDSYSAGVKRMYNGLLYIRNNTAGDDTEWVAAHWTQTNVMAQIPSYMLPLVRGSNNQVSNNGRDLVVTGQNAWAEGRGAAAQTTTTTAVTESTSVPVTSVADIKPGMACFFAGASIQPDSSPITVVSVNRTTSTVNLSAWVTAESGTSVTFMAGATGAYSHSENQANRASGTCSHAEGSHNTARGENSHVEGNNCFAFGENSHAGGKYMYALGERSFAHGRPKVQGNERTVVAATLDAENYEFILTLDAITAAWVTRDIGYAVIDNTYAIQAWLPDDEGDPNRICISQDDLPEGTTAAELVGLRVDLPVAGTFHDDAIALGENAAATESDAVAIGTNAVANAAQSLALLGGTTLVDNSIAIGPAAVGNAPNAIAIGLGTKSSRRTGLALGSYNADDEALFVVGCGTTDTSRADCLKIDINHHIWVENSRGALVDLTAALITANIL